MNRELTHQEASELLGAYALDALESHERDAVDAHVAGCGWCQAEATEHREVAALLSSGVAAPPPGLWDRISSAMEEVPPPLNLAAVTALKGRPRSSPRRDRRTVSMPARLVAAVSVAAVAIIGVAGLIGTGVLDREQSSRHPFALHGEELERTIAAAKADPTARRVDLRSGDGAIFAEAWMLADGRGYLVSNNLPRLDADKTYQLWAVEGIEKVSVGVLGPGPEASAFRASGPVTALAITAEDGGGARQPTADPLVVGRLA